MKKARMNISHFRFIFFSLKIFSEIVTTFFLLLFFTVALNFEDRMVIFAASMPDIAKIN